jgi:quercetin dioxygenase-like cupin family protein
LCVKKEAQMKKEIFNPIFKDTCTFLRTSAETHGEVSEMIVELAGHGRNPMHKHSEFTETFIVLEGKLGMMHKGKKIILAAGEKYTIDKGEPHCFYNPSKDSVKFHVQFTPGHEGAENMLRILYGMAADGRTDKKGIPKSLTTIALLGELGDTTLTGIYSLLNPLLKTLAVKARKAGREKLLVNKYCI